MARERDVVRYDDPTKLPMQWNVDEKGIEAIKVAKAMSRTHTGLYANIPIICKGEKCPYAATCGIKAAGMDIETLKGQRCPMEIAEITQKFQWYVTQLEVDPENIVDLGMIKELVDIDIMLERADKRMAVEGDFIEMVIVGMDEDGNALRRPEIRKSVDFKERMQKRKDSLLQLLNSTRKDKAGSKLQIEMDPSSYAAQLMEKKQQLDALKQNEGIIDITDIEVGEGDGE